ncbi:MAG TPA: nicotinate (nicotinamide) nucleotide adenylyltransferase [Thermotoga sp.]|nr:nicotinate (nicotinamide) nucleotide adenylyltransferase [Thermotoga sp.]
MLSTLEALNLNTKIDRLGIFGGSFNPPHNGHIIIANYALELLKLDLLLIVPVYHPPHKPICSLVPFEKRYEWLQKIFQDNRKILVSSFERDKGGISYSIHTVEYFSELFSTKPYFLIGEDALSYIEKWYKYKELLKKVQPVVYPRYCGNPYHEHAKRVLGDLFDSIIFLEAPLVQISSTDIRKRIRKDLPVRGMIPETIIEDVKEVYKNLAEDRC